jgi:hypothetical protein
MKKIQKGQQALTPEQEAYARQFAQERIAAMLSCATIDEQEAEKHLMAAYRVAGLPPPTMRWFDSPVAFAMAHFSSVRDSVWDSVRASVWASVWASVRDSVGDSVWASVGDSVWDSVRDSVGDSVGDSVWASVRDSVRDSVGDSVWASVWASVWDSVRDSVGDSVRAYFDENWLVFYQFFHEVFEQNDLIHLALFNEMVSGYRLGSKEAWLVRKPIVLSRDSRSRLHNASGMCMTYKDGWGFYAWHGVRVPEKIILHAELLSKADFLQEENIEVRRVIQERMGDRFVSTLGGKVVDMGARGMLYEVDITPDPEHIAKYVHVRDSSTDREYYLRVPPAMKTAQEAVAWTFGLHEEAYQPIQEA